MVPYRCVTWSRRADRRAVPVHGVDSPLQPRRPFAVRIEPQIGYAGKPGAHRFGACARSSIGSTRTRIRNISRSRSVLVSTVLGVNCDWVAMNDTLAGNRDVRIGIEHDARIGADLGPSRIQGRQVDVHVDRR